jgi:hypothetical protein
MTQRGEDRSRLAADRRHDREDGEGPDHAVAEDLEDRNGLHRLQVDREEAPGAISGETVGEAEASLAVRIVHAESYGAIRCVR